MSPEFSNEPKDLGTTNADFVAWHICEAELAPSVFWKAFITLFVVSTERLFRLEWLRSWTRRTHVLLRLPLLAREGDFLLMGFIVASFNVARGVIFAVDSGMASTSSFFSLQPLYPLLPKLYRIS